MSNEVEKEYVVVVQCHIVKERCSGYLCERAYYHRDGDLAIYKENKKLRFLPLTCGGCCGRAVHRKISNLLKMIRKKEEMPREKIVVHFASCIAKDNYHGPPCPHIDYLKTMIVEKLGLDLCMGTTISQRAEQKRIEGVYKTY